MSSWTSSFRLFRLTALGEGFRTSWELGLSTHDTTWLCSTTRDPEPMETTSAMAVKWPQNTDEVTEPPIQSWHSTGNWFGPPNVAANQPPRSAPLASASGSLPFKAQLREKEGNKEAKSNHAKRENTKKYLSPTTSSSSPNKSLAVPPIASPLERGVSRGSWRR